MKPVYPGSIDEIYEILLALRFRRLFIKNSKLALISLIEMLGVDLEPELILQEQEKISITIRL